jgi:gliding motility-associated-like protein
LALFGNPKIPIQDIMPICEGSSITVDAGSGNDSYSWSTGASSQQITVSTPGNYSVSVTQNHSSVNCSTTKSFTVVNSNIATIENIVLSEWTTANNTITVLLTSNSQGDYVYSLDGVNYQSGNTFENLPSGQYTVYVKDKNGCGITDKDVLLLMYPKFFTPNGDGYNDYWQIDNSTAKANFKILIFDRLGKLLKAIDSHSGGWDGTFNGQPLPSTDYWFTFTMSDGKEYKGHFALKR